MIIIFVFLLCLHPSAIFSNESNTDSEPCCNYDITGRDFLNTQTTKLCLLARLNVSIQFTYTYQNQSVITKVVPLPKNASKEHSRCDYNFVSLLQLEFDEISFRLNFTRDHVENLPSSPIAYCDSCDSGNWWLASIRVDVANTSDFMPNVPSTTLKSIVNRSQLISVDGGFSTGVSLQRGYRCKNSKLIRDVDIEEAHSGNISTADSWKVKVNFHYIGVQPFLVTNDIIKDPLLCEDYTLFLVFIILIPILYFTLFIAFYRLRDRYGCPNPKKLSVKRPSKKRRPDSSKQQLLTSKSSTSSKSKKGDAVQPASVLITCTPPDESETRVVAGKPDQDREVAMTTKNL